MVAGHRHAPVLAVLNMKGGVGKTTITASVSREVQRSLKKNVLLIDFDSQYNLTQLLISRDKYDELAGEHKTLLHVLTPPTPTSIFHISDADLSIPEDAPSYVTPLVPIGGLTKSIDLLPGDFGTAKINLMTERNALKLREMRFRNFVNHARDKYDLVVIDCNPASSFMTRLAVVASTHLLVPVRADKYSILGLEMISDFVEDIPTLTRQPGLSVIINEASQQDSQPAVIEQLRADPKFGPLTLTNSVPHSKHLSNTSNQIGFPTDRGGPYSVQVGDAPHEDSQGVNAKHRSNTMNLRQRLIVLLADPDISVTEYHSVTAWLQNGGLAECIRDASDIRRRLMATKTSLPPRRSINVNSDVLGINQTVSKLLRVEAKLTAANALAILAEKLGRSKPLPEGKGFDYGVSQLIKEFGSSAVLSVAHQVRNTMVHDMVSPAWPLKHDN